VDWGVSFSLEAGRLAGWFEREVGAGFGARRAEALALLQKEKDLVEVAELVGTESLQDAERLVIESARLLREGFLRQSSYDAADASCSPARAGRLLEAHLDVHALSAGAIARGVPLRTVLEAGLGAKLVALSRVPEAEAGARARALVQGAADALSRLEAE
jgi:V/A-type H+-transporting ATPase subunit A